LSRKSDKALTILSDLIAEPITFIDVGARGGVVGLRRIAKKVRAIGVEPNPIEKDKILSGYYSKDKRGYWIEPKYSQIDYFWGAITNDTSTVDLLVTNHPGASGIKSPNFENLSFRFKLNMTAEDTKNGFDRQFEVKEIVKVPSLTIDELMIRFGIRHIDFLKVDVEGNEYEVLKSISELSKKVSLIQVEVCFFPFRNQQKLFDEVFQLLLNKGFNFLTFRHVQKGYRSQFNSIFWNKRYGFKNVEATWMSADAYFIKYPDTTELKNRLALVLYSEGFMDQALICIKDNEQIYEKILKTNDRFIMLNIVTRLLDLSYRYRFFILLKKFIKRILNKVNP
jgi:FkbM family methyltransferase